MRDLVTTAIECHPKRALAISIPHNSQISAATPKTSSLDSQTSLVTRLHCALAATAWTAWKYGDNDDADDYVQTILVAKSLTNCGGFDHNDLVSRHRIRSGHRLGETELYPGGVHPAYRGQVAKLQRSKDPLYLATDGASDGAAMKVTAIAGYYVQDFDALIHNTDRIARITHASVEARLAAVLIALRLRQVLLNIAPDNMNQLLEELVAATKILRFGHHADFFLARVESARQIASQDAPATDLLYQLCRQVGMEHLAWSTPVTACFWSFHADTDFSKWFRRRCETKMYLPRKRFPISRVIHGRTLKRHIHQADVEHLHAIGQYDSYQQAHGYHWRKSIDMDTFLSIAISILAARHGLDSVASEVLIAIEQFGDDLWSLAEQLAAASWNEQRGKTA